MNRILGLCLSLTLFVGGFVGCALDKSGKPILPVVATTQPDGSVNLAPSTQPAVSGSKLVTQDQFDSLAAKVETVAKVTGTVSAAVAAIPSPATPWAAIVASLAGGIAVIAHSLNSKNSGNSTPPSSAPPAK